MQATLTFALPEEAREFKEASQAGSLVCTIQDLDSQLRNLQKYGPAEERRLTPEKVREMLRSALADRGAEWALD